MLQSRKRTRTHARTWLARTAFSKTSSATVVESPVVYPSTYDIILPVARWYWCASYPHLQHYAIPGTKKSAEHDIINANIPTTIFQKKIKK